jgi:hypothetical protein
MHSTSRFHHSLKINFADDHKDVLPMQVGLPVTATRIVAETDAADSYRRLATSS